MLNNRREGKENMPIETEEINATNMAQILGDGYSKAILNSTHLKPRTALEIADIHGIPIAACYRRIKTLENMGFIHRGEQILTQKGKRRWSYISNIHKIEIFYTEGKVSARCELRNGYTNQV